jgi:hypothetical protein
MIHLRRPDDHEKEVFVNNTKLTIDSVLNEQLKDFVKKSDTQAQVSTVATQSPFQTQQKPRTLNEDAAAKARERAAQELAKMKQAS